MAAKRRQLSKVILNALIVSVGAACSETQPTNAPPAQDIVGDYLAAHDAAVVFLLAKKHMIPEAVAQLAAKQLTPTIDMGTLFALESRSAEAPLKEYSIQFEVFADTHDVKSENLAGFILDLKRHARD